jgi:precorrin-8X/cobalt-precorrin-8 methylmutase
MHDRCARDSNACGFPWHHALGGGRRLLENIDAGGKRPAALFAFPVGFVGAEESKAELVADPRGLEFATLPGRRGGSAMAAAAINALFGNPEAAP